MALIIVGAGNMQPKIIKFFLSSVVCVLFATGVAKFISASGSARILESSDPILQISIRYMFWIAGAVELIVALVCLFARAVRFRAGMIAWLATLFLIYRLGRLWLGYQQPCACLGNLTDALHISPQLADNIMKGVLTYLLIGSYGILIWQWRVKSGNREIGKSETAIGNLKAES